MEIKTEWNGGTLTNIRLHEKFQELAIFQATRNITAWSTTIEIINQELYGFENDKEKTEIRRRIKELDNKINVYQLKRLNPRNKIITIDANIIMELTDLRYKLQEIFHRSGLQTSITEDAGEAF